MARLRLTTEKPVALSNVLYQTADFQIEVGTLEIIDVPEGTIGYRLRNKGTDVVEGEGLSESEALVQLYRSQGRRDEVTSDPAAQATADALSLDQLANVFPGGNA